MVKKAIVKKGAKEIAKKVKPKPKAKRVVKKRKTTKRKK